MNLQSSLVLYGLDSYGGFLSEGPSLSSSAIRLDFLRYNQTIYSEDITVSKSVR